MENSASAMANWQILDVQDQKNNIAMIQTLYECLKDSRQLLKVESEINKDINLPFQQSNKLALILTSIFITYTQETQIQWVAGIILKNTLKNNMLKFKENNENNGYLQQIKQALASAIGNQNSFLNQTPTSKLHEEYYLIVSQIITSEFNLDIRDRSFFDSIILYFTENFNHHVLKIIIQVFEDANDDRMWHFVEPILKAAFTYAQSINENMLLHCIYLMIQNLQWAVGVDPKVLNTCLSDTMKMEIVKFLTQGPYSRLYPPNQHPLVLLPQQIKEKRSTTRILTLLCREFLPKSDGGVFAANGKTILALSLQNLIYFMPIYYQVVIQKEGYQEHHDEDFEGEFQAFIVQLISLVSTLVEKRPKEMIQEINKNLVPIMQCLFCYCLQGIEQEQLYKLENKNGFLVDFFDNGEDDMSNVSIRSTVTELIDGLLDNKDYNREALEQTINLFQATPLLGQNYSNGTYSQLLEKKSISDIDIKQDLCYISCQPGLRQEVALFALGTFQYTLSINEQAIKHLAQQLTVYEQYQIPITKLRILWVIEKVVQDSNFSKEMWQTVFQIIFSSTLEHDAGRNDFIYSYQAMKTMCKIMKKINIIATYPDSYRLILTLMLQHASYLIRECNEETVHIPLEILTFLSKIDTQSCIEASSEVMPQILSLFNQYHQDGLIGADILELIKLWASVKGNEQFKLVFLPHIFEVVEQYYICTRQVNTANLVQAAKLIDSSIVKNMMSILTSFVLHNHQGTVIDQEVLCKLDHIYKIILEILNETQEIYICLYSVLCLASIVQAYPALARQYTPQLAHILNKISSVTSGQDESSCLYIGHLIVIILENELLDQQQQQSLLLLMVQRLARARLPSTIKSFLLPIAFSIIKFKADTISFIQANTNERDLQDMLSNWITHCHLFEGEFAQRASKVALIMLLEYTATNSSMADVKIKLSQYSEKNILLQTKLVSILVKDLIFGDKQHVEILHDDGDAGADYEDGFGDENYGEEECDDGDDLANRREMHKNLTQNVQEQDGLNGLHKDFGDVEEEEEIEGGQPSEVTDENLLMKSVYYHYALEQDTLIGTTEAFKLLGKDTLARIIQAQDKVDDMVFAKAEREAITNLFELQS